MKVLLWLAWQSLRHHPLRNALLVLSLAAVLYIPWAGSECLRRYDRDLHARAQATPLVLGQKGSRFDLCLGALFFRKAALEPLAWRDFEEFLKRDDVLPVPMHLGFTVRDLPLVCTTPEYLEVRGLRMGSGHAPHSIRQVALGSRAAQLLNAQVGDVLPSDPSAGFGIGGVATQALDVVGILEPSGGPDDGALFASLQTAWLLEGEVHGHGDAGTIGKEQPENVLATREGGVILSAAVV
ncbi:MAG: hypothetical protein KDB61_13095, partial [Planctomycetes bacterium]|nr:hypothetical protein [Planctomycetota bacterium]